ncbi:MAG: hypothetical protein OXU81_09180 [Gammaproteobacteria bacterium]|nr:hypothetical protein [Gammaproteobacteria bacterium]
MNVYPTGHGRRSAAAAGGQSVGGLGAAPIQSLDGLHTVTVSSELQPAVTAPEVVARLRPCLAAEHAVWPPDYRHEFGKPEETSRRANHSTAEQLPVGALIIRLLLIVQFNSVRRTATIPLRHHAGDRRQVRDGSDDQSVAQAASRGLGNCGSVKQFVANSPDRVVVTWITKAPSIREAARGRCASR